MIKVAKMQICTLFHRKSTIIMYFLMYLLVFCNFFYNVWQYYGYNYWNMCHPMKLSFLNSYSIMGFYFLQFYPLLLLLPAAFAYFEDKSSKEIVFIQARTNRKSYYAGTMLAVFITTFLVFTGPMLVEMGLNCIAFPLEAIGDQSNVNLFSELYNEIVQYYLFHSLWLQNPFVYTFLMILIFGIVTGVLACFATAFSMVVNLKYKVLLFIPVYLFLYLIAALGRVLGLNYSTNYFSYLTLLEFDYLNETAYLAVIIGIVVATIVMVSIKMKRDELC